MLDNKQWPYAKSKKEQQEKPQDEQSFGYIHGPHDRLYIIYGNPSHSC